LRKPALAEHAIARITQEVGTNEVFHRNRGKTSQTEIVPANYCVGD